MEALINAGGKGSRMGQTTVEKPMQPIGGIPIIQHVIDAMQKSTEIDHILVSVSPHTVNTEKYLKERGIETLRTSGEDFMMDLRASFSTLSGDYVLTCPSDVPFVTPAVFDRTIRYFKPEMQSLIVMVTADAVVNRGVIPSYTMKIDGKEWVLSGVSVMDRKATVNGRYLNEEYLFTDWEELAMNLNTQDELSLARKIADP